MRTPCPVVKLWCIGCWSAVGALLVLSSLSTASAADPVWKAAIGKVKITPTENMWMAGYAARDKPSEGVTQDLYAKALVVEDAAQTRQVFITLDLIGIPRKLREDVEQALQTQYGLPPAALLMNASHTHCGPEFRTRRVEDDANSGVTSPETERAAQAFGYTQRLQTTLVELVGDCLKRLEPARLSYTHARCGFAMNRRFLQDGRFLNSPNPDGPVDHAVPVLRIESPSGELRGLMFGYACHNTTLSFYQFCGDYAGYAQEYLEAAHPGVVAMFVLGCGGDQNPYPRRELEMAQQHGRSLSNAVEAALMPPAKPLTGPISAAIEPVTVEFAPPPSRTELEARLESRNRYEVSHARRLLAQMDAGDVRIEYPYLVQVVRLGPGLTIVALSGEVVVDYSLRLKRDFPGENLWVAGYSNDVFGYVPSLRVLKEGGYEGGGAMLYTSFPGPFAESIEDRIIGQVERLLQTTAAKP